MFRRNSMKMLNIDSYSESRPEKVAFCGESKSSTKLKLPTASQDPGNHNLCDLQKYRNILNLIFLLRYSS